MYDKLTFEKGHEPSGDLVEFPQQPVILRFTPEAYKVVEPEDLGDWQREIASRLGLDFEVSADATATVSFCKRGGTGAAYRCDSDVESNSGGNDEITGIDGLRPWNSQPVVLNFPPVAYAKLGPDDLEEWTTKLKDKLGLTFDIGGSSGGTVSFCQRGGTGAAYRCDSDI